MDEMLRKEDVLKALSAKIDELEKRDAKADVILGLATAMSVVKLMEGEPAEKQEPCADAISRQAVLDLAKFDGRDGLGSIIHAFDVEQLPPVNPAEKQESSYNSVKTELDYVSRQAVLEVIRKCHCEEWVKADIGAPIEALQSVTPAEKVGHWILLDECSNSGYYCSECHKRVVKEGWSNTVKKIKYCPNCGAKMQGVEE